jgi:hypothetical protein
MRLVVWRLALTVLGVLLGVLYLLVGAWFVGFSVIGGTIFFALLSVRVEESERPGWTTIVKGRVRLAQGLTLWLIAMAGAATAAIGSLHGWAHDARGQTAIFALFAMTLAVGFESSRFADEAMDWIFGGEFEVRVGDELAALPSDWVVVANLMKDRGGNVDYVVCGPRGAYVIEAKSGHFAGRAAGQAEANARFIRFKLRRTWVVPVVCVKEPCAPTKKGHVWVMSREHLRAWLLARRDTPMDGGSAAAALGR